MKPVVSTTLPPEDDLDALLGAFFRSEMPDPWPTFQPPLSREQVVALPARRAAAWNWPLFMKGVFRSGPRSSGEEEAPRGLSSSPPGVGSLRPPLRKSRLALAASVALLIAASLVLPGRLTAPGDSGPSVGSDASADPSFLRPMVAPSPDAGSGPIPDKLKATPYLQQDGDRTGYGIRFTPERAPTNK
jgi:hypothetical protein